MRDTGPLPTFLPTQVFPSLKTVSVSCANVWEISHAFLEQNAAHLITVHLADDDHMLPSPSLARISFPKLLTWNGNVSGMNLIGSAHHITCINGEELDANVLDISRGVGLLLFNVGRLRLISLTNLQLLLNVRFDHDQTTDIGLLAAITTACPSLVKLDLMSSWEVYYPQINAWTQHDHDEANMQHITNLMHRLPQITVLGYHYMHYDLLHDPKLTPRDIAEERTWVNILSQRCPRLKRCKFGTLLI